MSLTDSETRFSMISDYYNSYQMILKLDNKRVGEIQHILYRVDKEDNKDIIENLLGDLINHNTKQEKIKCYEGLILNLILNYKSNHYDGMFFSLNKNSYRKKHIINGNKHNTFILYKNSCDFLSDMVDNDYLISVKGKSIGHSTYKPGYVLFTEKFKSAVEHFIVSGIIPEKDLVKLRARGDRKPMTFKSNNDTHKLINLIKSYNTMMDGYHVELNGVPINSDIHRLFLDSLDIYARFHGEFQVIPSSDRKDITFDSEQTREIDIQASHITLLYATKGIDISNQDPYDENNLLPFLSPEYHNWNGCSLTRKDIKIVTMMVINNSTKESAIKALVNFDKISYKFGKKHKFYSEVIDAMLVYHSQVIDLFFIKDYCLTLMKQESEVMAEVLRKCVKKNLPVLPIHDSVVCMEEHVEEVNKIMLDSFYDKWHVHCKTKIK